MSETTSPRRKAILVLGMHRSGTSALTRVLNLLGVDLGGNFLKPASDNRLGFWEHADAVMLNEKLLHALGSSWDDTRTLPDNWQKSAAAREAKNEIVALVGRDFSGSRLWAIKDPRLCRLAPVWIEALESLGIDVGVLLVVRHPSEVAGSLRSRDGMALHDARLAWLEHVVEAEFATRNFPRALVLYDELLEDWRQTFIDAGVQMGIQWPKSIDYAAPAVEAFLTPQDRHHKADDGVATGDDDVAGQLYGRCVAARRNGGDLSSVVQLVDEYLRVSPLLLKKVWSLSAQVAEAAVHSRHAEGRLKALQDEIVAFHDTIKDNERRIHGLFETVHGKDLHIQSRDSTIQGKDMEIQRRDELICEMRVELRAHERLTGARDTDIQRHDALIAEKEAELRQLAVILAEKDAQLRLLADNLQECDGKLRRAEAGLRSNVQSIAKLGDARREAEKQLDARTEELRHSEHALRLQAEQNAALQIEISALAERANASSTRIAEIESSRSWALTRPLRSMKWWATGGRPGKLTPTMAERAEPALIHQNASEGTVADKAAGLALPRFDLRAASSGTVILTTRHCHHLALEMKSALQRAGIASEIIFDTPTGGYRDVPHFVICPQFFPRLPGLYVSFQMEQSVSSRWFTEQYIRTLENSFAIFDYSIANISRLQELGLHAKQMFYVPVGYLDDYPQHGTTDDYDCDVLFYGDIQNERRRSFIEALGRVCKVKVHNDLFGEALHAEMARARLIVNIHYYQGALLETTRLWECVSLGHLVVSERAVDMDQHPELQQVVDFVDVDDVSAMVERVSYWLANDDGRRQRQKQNTALLRQLPNAFDVHFYRFLLATDNITFDEFWDLAGSRMTLPGDKLCLNLPEYVARSQSFDSDNRFGFHRFTGLRHGKGWLGCAMSYKLMMRLARQEGRSMLTICEDDVEFLPDFEQRWNKIQTQLAESTAQWDVFSGLMANLHADARVSRTFENDDVCYVETDKLISMVFNVYGTTVFDIADMWDESDRDENTNTIDRYLENQRELRVLTTLPFLVGHKEDLHSTLWGFQNTQYSALISESAALLEQKFRSHLEARENSDPASPLK